jgi:hypothetical protein
MATRLKFVTEAAATHIAPAPKAGRPIDPVNQSKVPTPDFTPAPTRKRRAGWTAERQRKFIQHLALTGHVGEAAAIVGLSSSSAYRLCERAGAESFARAWGLAVRQAATRLVSIGMDRAINGRVERHYKNGELVMERRIPSDYLLTWFISRLDPATFGSSAAKAHALATGDPRDQARRELPGLMDSFEDVPEEECPTEDIDFLDDWLGETGSGEPIRDLDRG